MQVFAGLALLAVVVLLLEAALVLRRGARQQRGYLALLLGNLALLGWVAHGERFTGPSGAPTVELVGGLLACLLLVGVPGVLARLQRRALAAERYERAARLSSLREVLVPGAASAAEREFFEQIAAARAGRADDVVRDLRHQLFDAEPPLDDAIQERIVTVLLFAQRFSEAATQFETHLGDDPARFPGLAVQMVKAYGAVGDLEKAAQLMHQLEERLSPLDPTAHAVLLQARLHLLSYAGALAEVELLLVHPTLRSMHRRMRETLLATARERASSIVPPSPASPAAAAPVRPLLPIDRHLALFLEGVAARAAGDLHGSPPSRMLPPAAVTLVAMELCAYTLFALLLGDARSGDHLVRAGASFHPAVRAGEWWRLWTALFLHSNLLHVLFNAYVLFLLGRILEPLLGTARFICLFSFAGLAGNFAAVYDPSADAVFSFSAAGAVLGVMAALPVALFVRPGAWPEGWRREQLLNVGVLATFEIALCYWTRAADHYTLLGGVAGGAVAGLALVPGGLLGRGRSAQLTVTALLMLFCGTAARSAMALVREQPESTMTHLPRERVHVGVASLEVPAGSELRHGDSDGPGEGEMVVVHAVGLQIMAAAVPAPPPPDEAIGLRMAKDVEWLADVAQESHIEGKLETAEAPPVMGWLGRAQALRGREPHFLLLYYARPVTPQSTLLVRMIYRGDARASALLGEEIARTLASVEPAAQTP